MFRQLTDDERIAQILAQSSGQFPNQVQAPEGMITQSAMTPEQRLADARLRAARSTEGAQARIRAQQAMADSLRGTAMPEGRQAGRVYVAANPLEHIAAAAKQGLGGHMSGQLKDEYEGLDQAAGRIKLAEGDIEDAQAEIARDFRTSEREAGQEFSAGEQDERIQAQINAATTDEERALRRGKDTQMIDINNPQKGPQNVVHRPDGKMYFKDTDEPVPDGYVDWNQWKDNERQERAAALKGDKEAVSKQADKLDERLIKYSKDLDKSQIPRVTADIAAVDAMLAELPRDEDGNITGVPGVGYGQNVFGLGSVLSIGQEAFSGEDSPGDKATQFRSLIQRVLNTEIRAQSGAAVTLQEMVRNRIGAGLDWASSDEDFLEMWPVIKEALAEVKGNYDAGYGPDVVNVYDRRQAGEQLTTREYFEGLSADNALDEQIKKLEEKLGLR